MSPRRIGRALATAGLSAGLIAGCSWADEQRNWAEEQLDLSTRTQVDFVSDAPGGGILARTKDPRPLGLANGVILAGIADGAAGDALDSKDRELALRAQQKALTDNKSGQGRTWTNPGTGHSGSYTPTNVYVTEDGKTCRDYEQTVTIDGTEEKAVGSACKTADGSWRVYVA